MKQWTKHLKMLEKLLLLWVNEKWFTGDNISEIIICDKAKLLIDDLLKITIGISDADMKTFKASRWWFDTFLKKEKSHTDNVMSHEGAAWCWKDISRTLNWMYYYVNIFGCVEEINSIYITYYGKIWFGVQILGFHFFSFFFRTD